MDVEIKKLREPEEYKQAKINSAITFNFQIDTESDALKEHRADADTYGVFEDGKLVSQIIAYHFQMMYHGKYSRMCGIGDVCSLIGYRNRGYVRRLFHTIFDDEHKAGCLYSYLYPFSYKYYEKFGYGYGGSVIKAEIPIERLEGYKCDYDVQMYQTGDPYDPYKEVFEKFALQYTGSVERNDREWLDEFIPVKTHKFMYLFTENGVPRAFLGFRNYHNQGGSLHIDKDIAWDSPEAFRSILGFLYQLRMHNDKLVIHLPQSFPLEPMLTEQWGIKLERHAAGQSRIIDLAGALKAYPWPDETGTLSIGVRDEYFEEQCGTFRINYSSNGVEIEKYNSEPDIEMDINSLSPLLLGAYGFEDLKYYPAGKVSINKNIPVLEKVFTRKPVFVTERF